MRSDVCRSVETTRHKGTMMSCMLFSLLGLIKKPVVLWEVMKLYFDLLLILIYGVATFESLFLLLVHAWQLAPFIAPFNVPEAVKSLKGIGGRGKIYLPDMGLFTGP